MWCGCYSLGRKDDAERRDFKEMVMKVAEAAKKLEVSATTIYALVAAGKLRCYRVGMGRGCIRIADEHIAEYLGKAAPAVSAPAAPRPVPPRLKHLRLS